MRRPRGAGLLLASGLLAASFNVKPKKARQAAVLQADTTFCAPLQSQDTGAAALQFSWPRDDPHAVSHVT